MSINLDIVLKDARAWFKDRTCQDSCGHEQAQAANLTSGAPGVVLRQEDMLFLFDSAYPFLDSGGRNRVNIVITYGCILEDRGVLEAALAIYYGLSPDWSGS